MLLKSVTLHNTYTYASSYIDYATRYTQVAKGILNK